MWCHILRILLLDHMMHFISCIVKELSHEQENDIRQHQDMAPTLVWKPTFNTVSVGTPPAYE